MKGMKLLAIGGVAVGTLLIPTVEAKATFRSINATSCVAVAGTFEYGFQSPIYDGQMLNASASTLGAICSIPADTTVDLTSSSVSLTAYGFANVDSQAVKLQTCHVNHGGGGGACGSVNHTTTNGVFALSSFDMSGWEGYSMVSNQDSFYVYAVLGPQDISLSDNVLFSFYVSE